MELNESFFNDEKERHVKNIDNSKLNKEYNLELLRVISRVEFELDMLLTLTDEIGGFGSYYPKNCLEYLKTFRVILNMELGNSI